MAIEIETLKPISGKKNNYIWTSLKWVNIHAAVQKKTKKKEIILELVVRINAYIGKSCKGDERKWLNEC